MVHLAFVVLLLFIVKALMDFKVPRRPRVNFNPPAAERNRQVRQQEGRRRTLRNDEARSE
jgi:hypothetical protein